MLLPWTEMMGFSIFGLKSDLISMAPGLERWQCEDLYMFGSPLAASPVARGKSVARATGFRVRLANEDAVYPSVRPFIRGPVIRSLCNLEWKGLV